MGMQLVNESDQDFDLAKWADVLTMQAAVAAHAWRVLPLTVSVHNHPSWYRATLVNDIPEAPGALAYHDVDADGHPYIRIGVHTTLDAGESVSSALSHEVLELVGDPWCQRWDFDSAHGRFVAHELCDAVQSSSYTLDGVEVSDFLLPGWFGQGGALDYLGVCARPWQVARGGYVIATTGAGAVHDVPADADGQAAIDRKAASHGRSWWRKITAAVAATTGPAT